MHRHPITTYSPTTEMIHSQYGIIPYLDWCNREASRMTKGGKSVKVDVTSINDKPHCAVIPVSSFI